MLVDATGGGTAPTLELKTTTINNGTVTTPACLRLLAGSNTIHNAAITNNTAAILNRPAQAPRRASITPPATNTGKLLANGDSHLVLDTDTVTNTSGTVQVDRTDPTYKSTLELKTTTIDDGSVINHGSLEATAGVPSNYQELPPAPTPALEYHQRRHHRGGRRQHRAGARATDIPYQHLRHRAGRRQRRRTAPTLELKTTTINNGTVTNSACLEATAGSNTIHNAAITNNTAAILESTGSSTTLSIDHTTSFTNTGKLLATGDSHRARHRYAHLRHRAGRSH